MGFDELNDRGTGAVAMRAPEDKPAVRCEVGDADGLVGTRR